MKQVSITRAFSYNGIALEDPNPALSEDGVRMFYATMYPELLGSVIEGPVTSSGVSKYTFVRAAGSKGASLNKRLIAIAAKAVSAPLPVINDGQGETFVKVLASLAHRQVTTAALTDPQETYGIWG